MLYFFKEFCSVSTRISRTFYLCMKPSHLQQWFDCSQDKRTGLERDSWMVGKSQLFKEKPTMFV